MKCKVLVFVVNVTCYEVQKISYFWVCLIYISFSSCV